jgi:hypothetical protein
MPQDGERPARVWRRGLDVPSHRVFSLLLKAYLTVRHLESSLRVQKIQYDKIFALTDRGNRVRVLSVVSVRPFYMYVHGDCITDQLTQADSYDSERISATLERERPTAAPRSSWVTSRSS